MLNSAPNQRDCSKRLGIAEKMQKTGIQSREREQREKVGSCKKQHGTVSVGGAFMRRNPRLRDHYCGELGARH